MNQVLPAICHWCCWSPPRQTRNRNPRAKTCLSDEKLKSNKIFQVCKHWKNTFVWYSRHFEFLKCALNFQMSAMSQPIFVKIPWRGGQFFYDRIAKGVQYFGFYCIFINKFFENLNGGSYGIPLPPCVHLCLKNSQMKGCFARL